jgi:hypothetical protein
LIVWSTDAAFWNLGPVNTIASSVRCSIETGHRRTQRERRQDQETRADHERQRQRDLEHHERRANPLALPPPEAPVPSRSVPLKSSRDACSAGITPKATRCRSKRRRGEASSANRDAAEPLPPNRGAGGVDRQQRPNPEQSERKAECSADQREQSVGYQLSNDAPARRVAARTPFHVCNRRPHESRLATFAQAMRTPLTTRGG